MAAGSMGKGDFSSCHLQRADNCSRNSQHASVLLDKTAGAV